MSSQRFERALTVVLAAAAVVLAATAIRREFVEPAQARTRPSAAPTFEPLWTKAPPIGLSFGDTSARSTMVVFSDLECPACAVFHQTIKQLLRSRSKDLSVVFVHFPLDMHRFAVGAAQAAECAAARGRLEEFIDVVYAKQDSLGLKSWGSFAEEAGIPDTAAIGACARNPTPANRIEAGRALALEMGLMGTPTVIVNGQRFPHPPTRDEIERLIAEPR